MYKKYEELRNERNLTNYQVSKFTGISEATLSNWKRNISTPNVATLKKIADYLEVPVDRLI